MNKDVWSYFKHFETLLGKFYLFLTPSKTDEEAPSQQGAPSTFNLTYWEVSQQTFKIQIQLFSGGGEGFDGNWVWPKGYIHLFSGGWGEGLRGFWQIAHSSYCTHQITSDTTIFQFPRTYYFVQISQPAKICLKNRYFEEQIHWVPLKSRSWTGLGSDSRQSEWNPLSKIPTEG